MILQQIIETMYEARAGAVNEDDALESIRRLKEALNLGQVRAAECLGGMWRVNAWVKKGILLAFRFGKLGEVTSSEPWKFFDKDTMGLKDVTMDSNVRIVPGGSAIRDGSYVAEGVVMMPPSYVNIGAYVDEGTMIDSHALVGSCAQIGKRVHLSAGAQIGGVLEPVGSMPVIVEDEVLVGGNCGIYEGCIVRRRAVIAAGVVLTGSMSVYDVPKSTVYRKTESAPLTIPEGAVVVQGSRSVDTEFAREHHLSIYSPIIIKYRDEKTDASSALEESLR